MRLRDWYLRVRALIAPRRAERELDEELAFHIERETQKHIANGVAPGDARSQALARFGSVALAADECRDARGLALIDDLVRDILYAFRTFRRAPLAALTIVATMALGLGLVSAVFAVYNVIFLRADAVRNPSELFTVVRQGARGDVTFTRPEFEAMRRETNVFTDAVAMLDPGLTRLDGRGVTSTLVSGNFFQVLGSEAALGRVLTPRDDEQAAGRPVIVLSHAAWTRIFAGDPGAIGRNVRIGGLPYEIVGVMPEAFRGLQISPPDYWAPLAVAGQFRDAYATAGDAVPVAIVGRLKPGLSPEQATAGLNVWTARRSDRKSATELPAPIALRPRPGTLPADMESLLVWSPIFFAFGLILMIGCANVANLLLARGVARQREIGIRLSLGASRRRIVRQLLTENLLLALAAAACGLGVSKLFLTLALDALTRTMPMEILAVQLGRFSLDLDWRVVAFLMAGAVVATALFGLAPALQATRHDLVRTMRGELTTDGRPSRARHALIAVQVGASALLLICASVFLRGAFANSTSDPGVRTSDTVRLSLANEPRRSALLQELHAHPSVAAVAASSLPMLAFAKAPSPAGADADEPGAASSGAPVELLAVSPEYFDVLGIGIVSGRGFTKAERTPEAGVIVVSETVARQLWPNRNAIGQVLRLDAAPSASQRAQSPPSGTFTVVGVARDPGDGNNMTYLFRFRGAYLPNSVESAGTWLFLRVHGDPEETRQALLERFTRVDPDLAIITLRSMAGFQTYVLQFAFWLTVVLGGLALFLTVSGLFSVLSYVVEQRSKEIGVRMALGATTRSVAGLVLVQSLRPVGIGLLAGGGLAAAVAIVLMATPLASEIQGIVRVFDPLAYAASLAIIVAACLLAISVPALRAARLDPIATLRQD